MRALCSKCRDMTIHMQNDAQQIVCTICSSVLNTGWEKNYEG